MSILKLQLRSSVVEGQTAIVDILFNGTTIASNVELSSDISTLTYDVAITGRNTLRVNVLNPCGTWDGNAYSQSRTVTVSSVINGDITVLPQPTVTWTYPSGTYEGRTVTLTFETNDFQANGLNDPPFAPYPPAPPLTEGTAGVLVFVPAGIINVNNSLIPAFSVDDTASTITIAGSINPAFPDGTWDFNGNKLS